ASEELPPEEGPPAEVHRGPDQRDPARVTEGGYGAQERSRLQPERPRLALEAARREAFRRAVRPGRQHPGPAAGTQVPSGPERGPREGRHAVRVDRRRGPLRAAGPHPAVRLGLSGLGLTGGRRSFVVFGSAGVSRPRRSWL